MRSRHAIIIEAVLAIAACSSNTAGNNVPTLGVAASAAHEPSFETGAALPVAPPGAGMAVLEGDASIPAGHPRYAMPRGRTVVQVSATGPFVLTYVDPADMPTRQ